MSSAPEGGGDRLDEAHLYRRALDVADAIVQADPQWPRHLVQMLADEVGADTVGFASWPRGRFLQTRSENIDEPDFTDDELGILEQARAPLAAALAYRHAADRLRHRLDRLAPCTGRGSIALTPREEQVLSLVAGGSTNRQVARRLDVTERTVRKHLEEIYRRLDVTNRVAASRWWIQTSARR